VAFTHFCACARSGDAEEAKTLEEKEERVTRIKKALRAALEDQDDVMVLTLKRVVICAEECAGHLRRSAVSSPQSRACAHECACTCIEYAHHSCLPGHGLQPHIQGVVKVRTRKLTASLSHRETRRAAEDDEDDSDDEKERGAERGEAQDDGQGDAEVDAASRDKRKDAAKQGALRPSASARDVHTLAQVE
jgi:hypothetical protein